MWVSVGTDMVVLQVRRLGSYWGISPDLSSHPAVTKEDREYRPAEEPRSQGDHTTLSDISLPLRENSCTQKGKANI